MTNPHVPTYAGAWDADAAVEGTNEAQDLVHDNAPLDTLEAALEALQHEVDVNDTSSDSSSDMADGDIEEEQSDRDGGGSEDVMVTRGAAAEAGKAACSSQVCLPSSAMMSTPAMLSRWQLDYQGLIHLSLCLVWVVTARVADLQ